MNNEVVGFCRYLHSSRTILPGFEDIDCELMALYVLPKLKYNGIGTKLFEFVTSEFKVKNKKKMILWCLKDNEPSKKFYEKMGGKVVGEIDSEIGNKIYKEVGFIYNI